jgi:AraC family transcriptional regulator
MEASYIDWYKSGRLSSYVTSLSAVGDCFTLIEAAQPAGDMSDPATDDLVLQQMITSDVPYNLDFGAGRFGGRSVKRQLFLAAPSSESSILLDRSHHIRAIAFSTSKYADYLSDVLPRANPFDFGRLHAAAFEAPVIASMLERIWRTNDLGSPTSLLFAEGAALMMLAELAWLAEKPVQATRGGLAPWAARRVVEYLHANLAEDISILQLAAVTNLSPFHFARMFKLTMGVAPHAYQRSLRCERAKTLLGQTRQTVTAIAFDVGYESSQSFARMFRAETGMSPIDWRRQHFDVPAWHRPEGQTFL